jgi:3-deoxy-7-phosphoheptulonate synthase
MTIRNIIETSTEKSYLVTRKHHPADTIIDFGHTTIGGDQLCLIGGPCSVENADSIMKAAAIVKDCGALFLRGGAFKPRTSPYTFQGLGKAGLKLLREAANQYGLLCITEVLDVRNVDAVAEQADILQIGARNMQNYPLLKACARCGKPVLLKRAMSATLSELLLSAEYILAEGNPQVILCERGIRTFSDHSANTLDVSIIPAIREICHLPVIADPSHATGQAKLVKSCALAAVAAGAHGLMIEVHPNPAGSISDAEQAIGKEEFDATAKAARKIFALLRGC